MLNPIQSTTYMIITIIKVPERKSLIDKGREIVFWLLMCYLLLIPLYCGML